MCYNGMTRNCVMVLLDDDAINYCFFLLFHVSESLSTMTSLVTTTIFFTDDGSKTQSQSKLFRSVCCSHHYHHHHHHFSGQKYKYVKTGKKNTVSKMYCTMLEEHLQQP